MPNEKILVSIIIPVYNVEKYLNQCVDSVLNQTYKNIEVILVDDGSPDNCPAICDEYAKNDSRVKVVHKKNEGPSAARQAGIKISSGKYVMLVDGDDWLESDTVESCVNVIYNYPTIDCVIFSYVKDRDQGSYVKHLFNEDKYFLNKQEFEKNIYVRLFGLVNNELTTPDRLDYLSSCCMKLYRSDILNNAQYIDVNKVGSGEDGIFGIFALSRCESAVYIDKPFYHYRANNLSITSTYRPNLVYQWSCLFGIMQEYINTNKLSSMYQEALNNRIALGIVGIGLNGLSGPKRSFVEYKKYIDSYIKSDLYTTAIKTMKLKYLPITWKVLLFCCKYKMSVFVCIILKIMKFIKSKM